MTTHSTTFRDIRPIVIKIGGSTLEDIGKLGSLWSALVRVAAERPVVLVHGGGKAVDALLSKLGMTVERKQGLRVTPDDQMGLIAGVLAGTVNKQLVGAINAAGGAGGGRAVGLALGDGSMVECRQISADLGRVGNVSGGDAEVVKVLLGARFLPVVSCIGADALGGLLNVNADDAAAGIAKAVGAASLVLLTDVPGIKGGDGVLRPTLTASEIESMIAEGSITGGMIVKARSAVAAAKSTGSSVVIMSGESPDALAKYLGGEQVGTTIRIG
jgi:acetylglutamate kinase